MEPVNVDFIINNEKVKADARKVKDEITGVGNTSDKVIQKVGRNVSNVMQGQRTQLKETVRSIQSLKIEMQSYQAVVAKATDPRVIQQYNNKIAQTRAEMARLNQIGAVTGQKWNGLGNSINQLSREMPAFAVSAQVGILALSNNIPILADEIAKLKAQNAALTASGQKAVPVWRQVAKSILGWGTALSIGVTLLTVYGKEVGEFFKNLFKGSKSIEDLKIQMESLSEAYKDTDYKNAITSVMELRTNIELAKQGLIDKEDVVRQYNKSLGEVTGSVNTLAQAESNMVEKGDAYIKMMLYKVAATTAMQKASGLLIESQEKQNELDQKIAQSRLDILNAEEQNAQRGFSTAGGVSIAITAANQKAKEEQAELEKLLKQREELIKESNKVIDKFQADAAKIARENGFDLFPDPKGGGDSDSIARQRQALLDKISAIDREYARKRMADDEAEIQALRDKFRRIRELVERFNKANPSAAISLAGFGALQQRAEDDMRNTQAEKRTEKIRKEAEAAREKLENEERIKYANLLNQLMTYQQQKEDIEKNYAEKEKLLRQKYTGEDFAKRLELLMQAKERELKVVDDAAFRESELYRDMNERVLNMTRDQVKQQMAILENTLEEGNFTARDGAVMLLSEDQKKALEALIRDLEKFLEDTDPMVRELLEMGAAFSLIGGAVRDLSESLKDSNPELAKNLDLLSQMASIGASAVNAILSFKTGDWQQGVASSIQVLAGLLKVANEARASFRETQEELLRLQQQEEDGSRKLLALQRERNIAKAKEVELTLKGIKAQREALALAQKQLQQDMENLWGELTQQQFASGSKQKLGMNWLGLPTSEVVTEYASLVGKTYEEIEALYEQGKLTDRAKELFEQLRKLKEEGADIEGMLSDLEQRAREVFTGTTEDSIASGIIDGLKQGFTAVEDFAADLESLLQGAILNAIRYQALEEPLKEWYAAFAEFAESDGVLTEEEAAKLRAWYNTIVQGAIDLYDQSQGILDQNQLGSGQGGLKGAIRREMTEATASELTGLYRATFDVQKRHLVVSEQQLALEQQCMDYTFRIMQSSAMIEKNTADTVAELKIIVKQTKSRSGRDLGFPNGGG